MPEPPKVPLPPCPHDATPMKWIYSTAGHHKYRCEKCGRVREFPISPGPSELQDMPAIMAQRGRIHMGVEEQPRYKRSGGI